VTEAEARAALRAFVAVGGLECWIAAQRSWEAVPGGWTVLGELQGWRFRVEPVAAVSASSCPRAGGEPAVWTVPA
jgi:hypothetical protein